MRYLIVSNAVIAVFSSPIDWRYVPFQPPCLLALLSHHTKMFGSCDGEITLIIDNENYTVASGCIHRKGSIYQTLGVWHW